MDHADNVIDIHRPVKFSIEGRTFETANRRQKAKDLLRLAGLDPRTYELWELRLYRPLPVRYRGPDVVMIRQDARFVGIRAQVGVG